MAEKEVSELDGKILLKKTYLDKIDHYLTRSNIDDQELYAIVKKFFSEFLKLDYEFTYEELSIELNKVFIRPKVKAQIDNFLLQLSESEYLEDVALELDEIKQYFMDLKEIIQNIIFEDAPLKHSETIIDKVLHLKNTQEKITAPSTVLSLIDETNFYLSSANIDKAKKSYTEALRSYETLSKNERRDLADRLKKLYDDLQTLIKNPQAKFADSLETTIGAPIASDGVVIASDITSSKDTISSKDPMPSKISKDISAVASLIDETAFYIHSGNVASAKKFYVSTLKAYELLSSEDRHVLHDKAEMLYKELQELITRYKKTELEVWMPEKKSEHYSIKTDIPGTIEKISATEPAQSSPVKSSYAQGVRTYAEPIQTTQPIKADIAAESRSSENNSLSENKFLSENEIAKSAESTNTTDNIFLAFGSGTNTSENNGTLGVDAKNSSEPINKNHVPESRVNMVSDIRRLRMKNFDIFLENASQAIRANMLEDAQKHYSNALRIYTSMGNKSKKEEYKKIRAVSRALEDIRHQKSLHNLLETHLTAKPQELQKIIEKVRENAKSRKDAENASSVSSDRRIAVVDTDQNFVRINELIEESYFNIDNRNIDVAILKYFKALGIYHTLQNAEKKRSYWNIYLLYKKLYNLKSTKILAQDYLS